VSEPQEAGVLTHQWFWGRSTAAAAGGTHCIHSRAWGALLVLEAVAPAGVWPAGSRSALAIARSIVIKLPKAYRGSVEPGAPRGSTRPAEVNGDPPSSPLGAPELRGGVTPATVAPS
jgi:hypothetical protein